MRRRSVDAALKRIAQLQPATRAFIAVRDTTDALAEAEAADKRGARGVDGRAIAVKDNLCTAALPTTAASRMLHRFAPPYDATAWSRLRAAGAVLIGKTNMDELGMGSEGRFSAIGPAAQPNGTVAGGSSSGSALAAALGMAWAALGSDTGGSVRVPAAYCGVYGLKPTYGNVSRHGLVAYASSLDTVGILARHPRRVASVLAVLTAGGADTAHDATTTAAATASTTMAATDLAGLTVGVPTQLVTHDLPPATARAWEEALHTIEARGATLVPVTLPTISHALAAYYVVASAEAASNLARYDGVNFGHRSSADDGTESTWAVNTRGEGFGAEVQRRLLTGTFVLSARHYDSYYQQAQRVRRLITDELLAALAPGRADVLLTPTTPSTAPLLDNSSSSSSSSSNNVSSSSTFLQDLFTVPASLAGLPALSVPFTTIDKRPLGMQLIGRPFSDAQLLMIAERWLEPSPDDEDDEGDDKEQLH